MPADPSFGGKPPAPSRTSCVLHALTAPTLYPSWAAMLASSRPSSLSSAIWVETAASGASPVAARLGNRSGRPSRVLRSGFSPEWGPPSDISTTLISVPPSNPGCRLAHRDGSSKRVARPTRLPGRRDFAARRPSAGACLDNAPLMADPIPALTIPSGPCGISPARSRSGSPRSRCLLRAVRLRPGAT